MSYKGLWFKMSADYLDDPKIMAVGIEAECLFIRSIAWAKKQQTPIIPAVILPRIAMGVTDLADAVGRLTGVGLWTYEHDGTYKIAAWETWQANERNENQSKGGTLAMHNRWHQHKKSPSCAHCQQAAEKKQEKIVAHAPEAERLASLLAELMVANGCKKPTVTDTWIADMERIHRIDGHDWAEIERVLRWCQSDPFWQSNILSPAKFRKQFDQLRLKSMSGTKAMGGTPDALVAWEEVMAGVRKYGSYQVPEWSSPRIRNAIQMVGGYRSICSSTQVETMKRQFLTAYADSHHLG